MIIRDGEPRTSTRFHTAAELEYRLTATMVIFLVTVAGPWEVGIARVRKVSGSSPGRSGA